MVRGFTELSARSSVAFLVLPLATWLDEQNNGNFDMLMMLGESGRRLK